MISAKFYTPYYLEGVSLFITNHLDFEKKIENNLPYNTICITQNILFFLSFKQIDFK